MSESTHVEFCRREELRLSNLQQWLGVWSARSQKRSVFGTQPR